MINAVLAMVLVGSALGAAGAIVGIYLGSK